MIATSTSVPDVLRVLVDPTRLRILGLLERDELSVGELGRALEMAQSRVSNHLRVLREAGLLDERHEGRTTFLRMTVWGMERDASDLASRLWTTLRPELGTLPEFAADLSRLERVLAERGSAGDDFFERVAGEWDKLGGAFASGNARERVAVHVLGGERVLADLGCGTGLIARSLVGSCARLICVDRSPAMLKEAQEKLVPLAGRTVLEFRRGELDELPLVDEELDGCIAGLVLHHVADLRAPLQEMARVLKPGGSAVVLELAPHKETWMREALGDRHLGLDAGDVVRALERAGFEDVRLESVDDRYRPARERNGPTADLPLYIARATKPRARS